MINSRASERYAKSLLTLSIDNNIVDEVKSDIDLLIKYFKDSREVLNLYSSPIIPINHKINITNKIFKKILNKNTLNLLLNLIYRKRDNLMFTILLKYKELYNEHMNIEESVISTPFNLDKETLDVVHDFAKKLQVKKFLLRIQLIRIS